YFEESINYFLNTNNIDVSEPTSLVYFLTLLNGLFKKEREYDVFLLSQKINEYSDLPISHLSMRIFRYISFSSYFSGYYQYDIDLNRDSIIPLSKFFPLVEEMKARLDFGVSLFQVGNIQSSLYQLEKVHETIDSFDNFRYYSALLNNLGIVYYYTGYFENYLQLIISGLGHASSKNYIDIEIDFLYNLYVYHMKIENWATAYDYLKQFDEKANELGDSRNLALVYEAYATYYRDSLNDTYRSLKYLTLALEHAKESNYYSRFITIISELIDTYISVNEYELATNYIELMKNDATRRGDNSTILFSHVKYANLYFEISDIENATIHIDKIKNSDISELIFSKSQAMFIQVLARHEINNSNYGYAIELLSNFATDLLSRIKNSSEIQSGHLLLENEYLSVFQLLIDQLDSINDRESVIYWMDEIKNLSSASFYNNPALKASILSENDLVLDFALRNRIERLRSELRIASDERRVQINNLLIKAISQQNALRRKVLQNIDFEPVNMNRLRRELGRSDIILYFSIFHEDLYVSKITSGSFDIQKITFSEEDFNRIEDIVISLSSDKVRLTELAWLKEKIIGKNGISDRYTNYFIIPDGFLYHIPFEILPVGNIASDYSYGEATYLIEHAAVSYSNSLKDLKASLNHKPQRKYDLDFVGFGITHFNNPESQLLPGRYLPALPLAEREVEDISANLNSFDNNIFFDSNTATEYNFRQNSGNSRILHFASHSEVFENDPLYSVIYLNQEGDGGENRNIESSNDGFVYAYELFQMDLSSEMVMLNSCESGSGNYIQGSGIVGFSRAFNYAGVPSLVMNLWSVRDRSAYHLSVSFYDYLNQGYSKSEAMRKAKIHYLNKFNSNPTTWGSFVVYGNIDPITPSRNPWILVAVFLIIGGISLIVAWLRLPAKIKQRLQ
ncbi:MAG: CHAT domain-containing protein, partial [Balneolaceae bacterium]